TSRCRPGRTPMGIRSSTSPTCKSGRGTSGSRHILNISLGDSEMATVAEQIAADKARRRAQAEQEATVQAQPGPTQAKADLDRAQRVEALTRQAVGNENAVGGGLFGYG